MYWRGCGSHAIAQDTHLSEAVDRTAVFGSVNSLHLGFDNVERVITQCGEAAGGHTAQEVLDVGQVALSVLAQDRLVLVEPHEPQSLSRIAHKPNSRVSNDIKKYYRHDFFIFHFSGC